MQPDRFTSDEDFLAAWTLGTVTLAGDTAPPKGDVQKALRRYVAPILASEMVAQKRITAEQVPLYVERFSNSSDPKLGLSSDDQAEYDLAITRKLADPGFLATHGTALVNLAQGTQGSDPLSGGGAVNIKALQSGDPQLIQTSLTNARSDYIRSTIVSNLGNKPGDPTVKDVMDASSGGSWGWGRNSPWASDATKGLTMAGVAGGGRRLGQLAPGAAIIGSGLVDVLSGESPFNRPEDKQKAMLGLADRTGRSMGFKQDVIDFHQGEKAKSVARKRYLSAPRNANMSGANRNATFYLGMDSDLSKKIRDSMSSVIGTQATNNAEHLAADTLLEPQAAVLALRNMIASRRAGQSALRILGPKGAPGGGLKGLHKGIFGANVAWDLGSRAVRNFTQNPSVADVNANQGWYEAGKRGLTDILAEYGNETSDMASQIDRSGDDAGRTFLQKGLDTYMGSDLVGGVSTFADQGNNVVRTLSNMAGAGVTALRGGNYAESLVARNERDRAFDKLVQQRFDPTVTKNWTAKHWEQANKSSLLNPLDHYAAQQRSQLQVENDRMIVDTAKSELNRLAARQPTDFMENYRGKVDVNLATGVPVKPRKTKFQYSDYSHPWETPPSTASPAATMSKTVATAAAPSPVVRTAPTAVSPPKPVTSGATNG